ncbi:hypothetical protein GGR51DRAFT_534238 [Nemania sp. FL0031]|nr:hypothetical protein GGR51DRAFT_534238 [Nemania sp. FL0031]
MTITYYRPIAPNGEVPARGNTVPPRRSRPPLAQEKCDNCRKDKQACLPIGGGCQRCTEKNRNCPGLTPRPKRPCNRNGEEYNTRIDRLLLADPGPHIPGLSSRTTFDFSSIDVLTGVGSFDGAFRELDNRASYEGSSGRYLKGLCCLDERAYCWHKEGQFDGHGEAPPTEPPNLQMPRTSRLERDVPGTDVPGTDVPGTDVPERDGPVRKTLESGRPDRERLDGEKLEKQMLERQTPEEKSLENKRPQGDPVEKEVIQVEVLQREKQEALNTGDNIEEPDLPPTNERELWRFRSNFIGQYKRLKNATEDPSTGLEQNAQQLRTHREAWTAAVETMRQLCRLDTIRSFMDVLCFLCVSMAVADTDEANKILHAYEFAQSLKQWEKIFPGIEDTAKLIWDIDLEGTYPPPPTAKQHNEMLQLRDNVAALIATADSMFGLSGGLDVSSNTDAPRGCQVLFHKECTGRLMTSMEREPPDRLICPAIASLQEKTRGTIFFKIVPLVTTMIFSLVVYFMLGFAHRLSPIVLGLPNPWYIHIPKTISTYQTLSFATPISSQVEAASPSLLSRPSTPFNIFHPSFDISSSPMPASSETLSDIVPLFS